MTRTLIDIDPDKLTRAQQALRTETSQATVDAALDLAAAVDAERRSRALEAFHDLLGRLDTDLIERDEADDHSNHVL